MLAEGIPASKIGIGNLIFSQPHFSSWFVLLYFLMLIVGMAFYGSCWGSPITQPVQNLGGNSLIATDGDMSYTSMFSLLLFFILILTL
jgi:hypothetical protein